MAKVRIEVDADRFDNLFGSAALLRRFEGAPAAAAAETVPTLDLVGIEIEAVPDEIEDLDLTTIEVESVDESGS